MNYFELFELPVSLQLDKTMLRKKYFELSRKYHPDHFAQQDAAEQEGALEASAQLNKAYKTLTNGEELIRYVLMEKGLLAPDEKYVLPPGFLMEMMELNEALPDVMEDETAKESFEAQLQQLEKDLYKPVQSIIEKFKDGVTTESQLLAVKDYYFKKKYLQRLVQQLDQKL